MGYWTTTITLIIVLLLACLHIAEVEAKPKLGLEKISHLHFYFHDLLEGTNMTAVGVASSPATDSSLTQFGMVRVMDDSICSSKTKDRKQVAPYTLLHIYQDVSSLTY